MPLNPLSRGRAPRPNPADDPTLAEDLLGVPAASTTSGGVETIDSAEPVAESDHELGRLLADRAPRAHLPWGTTVLAAAVLLAIGYVAGGYHYHNKTSGSSAAAAFPGARTGARAGAGAFGGFGAGGTGAGTGAGTGGTGTGVIGGTGAGTGTGTGGTGGLGGLGGATIGTVKLVDGNNVYLTTAAGATVKVTLAPTATVTVTAKGRLSDLAPGTSVVVVGATAADGTVTATAVTQGGGFGGARAGG